MTKQRAKPRKAGKIKVMTKARKKKPLGKKEPTLVSKMTDALNQRYGAFNLLTREVKENIKASFGEHFHIPVKEESKITLTNGGCRTTMTGGEMMRAFSQKEVINKLQQENFELRKAAGVIPDIPKEEVKHWFVELCAFYKSKTDNQEVFTVLSDLVRIVCKQFPQDDLKLVLQRLSDVKNKFDDNRGKANAVRDQIGTHGNWNSDQYNHGYYNGIELILSIFENREPKFRDAPAMFLAEEKIRKSEQSVDLRQRSTAELITAFLKECAGQEDMIPTILGDINSQLLNRLKEQAERTGEASAVARKRFESALEILRLVNPNERKGEQIHFH